MNRTVREVTYDVLRELGMTVIFGNPGSNELPFLKEMPSDFNYVLALHERSAADMAIGYSIGKGCAAFVNLHSIAGVGNGLSGIVDAYYGHAPLVITAGQQDRRHIMAEPFLLSRGAEVVKPYVKWVYEPLRAEDVPAAIARGYYVAMQPPRGPVFISIPMDDWNQPCPPLVRRNVCGTTASPDRTALEGIVAALEASSHPALVVGSQIEDDEAWHEVIALAEHLDADVHQDPIASRWTFPRSHRLFCGDLPRAQRPVCEQLSGYDTVLVLGAPVFLHHAYVPSDPIKPGTRLFQITNSPGDAASALAGSSMVGNIAVAAQYLRSRLKAVQRNLPARRPKAPEPKPAYPMPAGYVFHVLNKLLPKDAVLVGECPSAMPDLFRFVELNEPGSFYTTRSGILGFGMPFAVGLQMANSNRRVVSAIGDGSAQYSIQALWSAVQYRAAVIFIVLCNGCYSALKGISASTNAGKIPGLEIPHIDMVKLAEGYGLTAEAVDRPEGLEPALAKAFASNAPYLISVNVQ